MPGNGESRLRALWCGSLQITHGRILWIVLAEVVGPMEEDFFALLRRERPVGFVRLSAARLFLIGVGPLGLSSHG